MNLEEFRAGVQAAVRAELAREHPRLADTPEYVALHYSVTVRPGPKYTKVDVGTSGRFMVVNETGEIFGIKGYGVIHRKHAYGTLDNPSPKCWLRGGQW